MGVSSPAVSMVIGLSRNFVFHEVGLATVLKTLESVTNISACADRESSEASNYLRAQNEETVKTSWITKYLESPYARPIA